VLAKTLERHSLIDVDENSEADKAMLGHMMIVAARVAQTLNLKNGYRIVSNNGKNSHQTIHNLYIHVIGGQQLSWPPFSKPAPAMEENKTAAGSAAKD